MLRDADGSGASTREDDEGAEDAHEGLNDRTEDVCLFGKARAGGTSGALFGVYNLLRGANTKGTGSTRDGSGYSISSSSPASLPDGDQFRDVPNGLC